MCVLALLMQYVGTREKEGGFISWCWSGVGASMRVLCARASSVRCVLWERIWREGHTLRDCIRSGLQ